MEPRNAETRIVFSTVVDAVKVYIDQTGHFPVTSIRVVKYTFIIYSYDANTIFSDTLKSITYKGVLQAYTTCYDYLKERGFNAKIYWLDNEASNDLKNYNQNQGV